MSAGPRLYASVSHRTKDRVEGLARSEDLSVSRMTATLIREGLEARAVERERLAREFDFPAGLWLGVRAETKERMRRMGAAP